MPDAIPPEPRPDAARQRWMGLLAQAPAEELKRCWEAYASAGSRPRWTRLRGPEAGMVMLRGRIGGDGQPFNWGEMTVTRCSVRLANGTVGHGYVPGIAEAEAELAAVIDGLMQDPALRPELERAILAPLEAAHGAKAESAARRAAATKVEFFTLVRGD
jgi:alpha-D-ribose 1-methylphosphonate 5-triphosphate synthase subunit PhnG